MEVKFLPRNGQNKKKRSVVKAKGKSRTKTKPNNFICHAMFPRGNRKKKITGKVTP